MNTRNILFKILFGFIATCLLAGCKDDAENAFSIFDISAEEMEQSVNKGSETFKIAVNTNLGLSAWQVETTEARLQPVKDMSEGEAFITATVEENTGDKARTAQIKVSSPIKDYVITVRQFGAYDIVVEGDEQVKPIGGKDNQHQENYDITKSFDDLFTTKGETDKQYHSPFSGATKFPVILEYFFNGDKDLDYFIYYTRNGNGNFGKVEVFTATNAERDNYVPQGSYDFNEKNAPSKKFFQTGPVKATAVKFVITSGLGGYASCDEMEFYRHNQTNSQESKLLKVFTDLSCSEVKGDATEADIQDLPDNFFIDLARTIKNNGYSEWEKDFRIREYKAYSDPYQWAKELKTKRYASLDNLTGISVEKDDEVIVLVGDTHGNDISLQCVWEETLSGYQQTARSGPTYVLRAGINRLKMESEGQLFVMYNCDLATHPQPVKIHIPIGSGKVSGFFDMEEHKTDLKYAQLLSKATHKYFGIRGENIIFYFHRESLLSVANHGILSAIHLWDQIIGWEQELMGIEDIRPTSFNNHLFAISPEGNYMWADNDRIGFVYDDLEKVLSYDEAMADKDNIWGPAHEIGHVHQGAINWPSCTESSNNLFSNYILYKLGKYCSRGREISQLADSYRQGKSWVTLGDEKNYYQNEDAELHMRMQWQLWNYFHRLGNMPDFFPKLFKYLRAHPLTYASPGTAQMQYATAVCTVANMDMTEFFDRWGFFRFTLMNYEQYGSSTLYMVSNDLIKLTKDYMATFDKKVPPICYLEDRKNGDVGIGDYQVGDVGHYSQFKDNVKITGIPTYTLSGNKITINNGAQAVAFEVRKDNENGELLYFFNFLTYSIPSEVTVDGTTKFYAVQADGKRIEMKKE